METLTRFVLLGAIAGLAWGTAPSRAQAQNASLPARVVWVGGDRVYLVAHDSLRVDVGSSLRFLVGGRQVATGQVTGLYEARLITARVNSGSLLGMGRLQGIEVTYDPVSSAERGLIRIGYPSPARSNQPFFRCRSMTMNASGYRADTLGTHAFRMVRDSLGSSVHPGPDTLLVRLFDDVADEEIALERGELDVAVFWPGEASLHIREAMRWDGKPKVLRPRGVVTLYEKRWRRIEGLYRDALDAVRSLNDDLFRGDLVPIGTHVGLVSVAEPKSWFEVDSLCPGHKVIERSLNRKRDAKAGQWLYVAYEDVTAERALDDSFCLFAISCPVLSRPELRPYLDRIDLPAIVNLFDCETEARKP